jgi:4a-hydroxytetrahydrobiopterin dehydratase
MELTKKHCVPCEGGVCPLDAVQVQPLLAQVPGWQVEPASATLRKRFEFASFPATIAFVDRLADLAEAEGHHPDFCVHYKILDVTLTTHAIGGLSENDFILAAKIDSLVSASSRA